MKPVEVVPSQNKNDRARIVCEARGVCLILGPWNFPLGLVMGPLAAAIAAGNCCIVKLTDLCPATARAAARTIKETFAENEVAVFEGGVDVATALLELPFSHIFFTGSTRVGKLVMAAAAKHLATVTLELGGKSPVIVDEGADLKKVAGDLAAAKQFNGGQACICPDYVFVKSQQQEDLVQEFRSRVKQNLYTEDGKIKKDNIAQIVDARNFTRIKQLFDDAVSKGAKVAVGGTLEAADRTVHPTMLTGVTPDMQIMQEEIFGPIVPVLTYQLLDEVIGHISSRGKPLALYIYSNNQKNIDKVLSRTSSGGVTINGFFSHYLENQLPFGGVNQSGMGSYHGYLALKLSRMSALSTFRRIDSAVPQLRPPGLEHLGHQFAPYSNIRVYVVRRRRKSDNRARPHSEIPDPTICQIESLQVTQWRKIALCHLPGILRTISGMAAPDARADLKDRPRQLQLIKSPA